ncbi:hypothetical protein pipiens_016864 [Culex pipiens pipiens]|uniref:T-box domain-containing protein n=1 Tax=Culex pipiens pipiens TaxID=38569 RepID=A0ABD1CJD6_CULPP
MLPVPIPQMHAMALPPRYQQLPGVEMKLQNKELWRDFHKIGTEMIITKCGRDPKSQNDPGIKSISPFMIIPSQPQILSNAGVSQVVPTKSNFVDELPQVRPSTTSRPSATGEGTFRKLPPVDLESASVRLLVAAAAHQEEAFTEV